MPKVRFDFWGLPSAVFMLLVLLVSTKLALAQQAPMLDHFSWSSIGSPQRAGEPIMVTVDAVDISGNPVTSFNGAAEMAAVAQGKAPSVLFTKIGNGVELSNLSQDPVDVSGWKVVFYDYVIWPQPRLTFTLPAGTVCPPKGVFQIAPGTPPYQSIYPGSYPNFMLGNVLMWNSSDNIAAVLLLDSAGSPVDFFCEGRAFPSLINLPFPISESLWSGPPAAMSYSLQPYQRVGHAVQHSAADWTVAPGSYGSFNTNLAFPLAANSVQTPVSPGTITFTNGRWRGLVTMGAGASNVILRADDKVGHSGDSSSFDVRGLPALGLQIPHAAYKATPGPVGPCSVTIPQPLSTDLLVAVSSSLPGICAVPASVSIPSGASSASFWVTNIDDGMLTGPETAAILVAANGYASAADTITNYDKGAPTLSITLTSSNVVESANAVVKPFQGTIFASATPASNVLVSLFSSQPGRVLVPDRILLPAGKQSAGFSITAPDNNRIDGNQEVTITAMVPGWTSGQQPILVIDNEGTRLFLSLPSAFSEGAGVRTNAGGVWISGVLSTNLTITLDNTAPLKVKMPSSVVIPAGQTFVNFDITVSDDALPDGDQLATVTASSAGWTSASFTISILDNDLAKFVISGVPAHEIAGQPFAVTVHAETGSGAILQGFSGNLDLSANDAGPLAVEPTVIGPFTNGIWSGLVKITTPSPQARLTLADRQGHSVSSDPIEVISGKLFALPVSDLVYDPVHQKVDVGILGGNTNGRSVMVMDPATGAETGLIAIGSNPGKLAISKDGQFLYVAKTEKGGVARINLDSGTVDLTFNVEARDGLFQGLFPLDMAVPPGDPHALVCWVAANQGVSLYRDGVPSPKWIPYFNDFTDLVFYDSATNFYSVVGNNLWSINISEQGLNLTKTVPGYGASYIYGHGLLFSTTGEVYDPAHFQRRGAYPTNGLTAVNFEAGQVYFLNRNVLRAFDIGTFAEIANVCLPTSFVNPKKLVSCGLNGVAIASTNALFLFRPDFIGSPALTDLSIKQSASVSTVTVGSNLVYSITVSNAGPKLASNVVLADVLPVDATFVSAATPQGSCTMSNGIVRCELGSLDAGASLTVAVTIQPSTIGTIVNRAWLIGDGINPDNSSSSLTNSVVLGSELPAITRVWFSANSLAYNASRNRLWASASQFDSALENSIRFFDLNSGIPGTGGTITNPVGKIAISGDQQYIYAVCPNALIRRFNIASGAWDLSFSVDNVDDIFSVDNVADIIGISSWPSGLAIARSYRDVAIHNDGVAIRSTLGEMYPGALEADPNIATRLYMLDVGFFGDATVSRLDVGSTPIAVLPGKDIINPTHQPTSAIRYGNGRLFTDLGMVVDAETLTNVCRLPVAGLVQTDPDSGLVYYLTQGGSGCSLVAYDIHTLSLAWSCLIPDVLGTAANLTKCTPGVLAFSTSNGQLFLVNTAKLTHTIQADLSLTISVSTNMTTTNLPVTFVTTVTNAGLAPQSGVMLTNQLPAAAKILSIKASQGTVTNSSNTVICDLGGLPIGASATLQVVATLNQSGILTNMASVNPSASDPVRTNDFASAAVQFNTIAISDLSISSFLPGTNSAPDGTFTYTLVISNAGPDDATNVVVADSIIYGAKLVAATSSQGTVSINEGSLSGNLGTLGAGNSATVTLTLGSVAGVVMNNALVSSDNFDPNSADNRAYAGVLPSDRVSPNLIDKIPIAANDIAYDPASQTIVLSGAGSAGTVNNGIFGFSLASNTISYRIPTGTDLGRLAVSDDGHYAYASTPSTGGVMQVDIPSRSIGMRFPVIPPGAPGAYQVADLAVMPGSPDTLAVAGCSGYYYALALFDGGVQRPGVQGGEANGAEYSRVGFANASTLCASQPNGFQTMSVNPGGLSTLSPRWSYPGDFTIDGGLVFMADGRVFNPNTGDLVRTFPEAIQVVPDMAHHRVYVLTADGYLFYPLIVRAFDSDIGVELWSLPLYTWEGNPQRFISLGTNGLAFITDAQQAFIVRTPQLAKRSADLSITSGSVSTIALGGTVTYSFAIGNAGPCPAMGVVFSNALPVGADYVSASSTVGTCKFADGVISCDLGNMSNNASATVTVTLKTLASGTFNEVATVSSKQSDGNPFNNSATVQTTVIPVPPISIYLADATAFKPIYSSTISFPVTLAARYLMPVTVGYETQDGTAHAGVDYTAASGNITFQPGWTNQQIVVTLRGSSVITSNKYFFIKLKGLTNLVDSRTQAVGTILEPQYRTIKITGTNIVKGDAGFSNAVFRLSLSQSNTVPVTVQYQTLDGTATAGIDYIARTGTLEFPSGTTNLSLAVPVLGNNLAESNQTFFVVLSQPSNGVLGVNEAMAIITSTTPLPPLAILKLEPQQGGAWLNFDSVRGRLYRLERSLSLEAGSWTVVLDGIPGTGSRLRLQDPEPTEAEAAYYRLVQLK